MLSGYELWSRSNRELFSCHADNIDMFQNQQLDLFQEIRKLQAANFLKADKYEEQLSYL